MKAEHNPNMIRTKAEQDKYKTYVVLYGYSYTLP